MYTHLKALFRLGLVQWMYTHLGTRDEEETAGKQQSLHCGLHVTKLDSIEVENALTVGKDKRIQCKDLEHLKSGHQCTASLLYDVTYYNNNNN